MADRRYAFGTLLLLTVASTLVGELAHALVHLRGVADALPALLRIVIPPFVSGALFPYLVIRLLYRQDLREFGVRWVTPGRPVVGWVLGATALVLACWIAVWAGIYGLVGLVPEGELALSPETLTEMNPLYRAWFEDDRESLALVLHMAVYVGFAEELFARGLLFHALERRYPGRIGGPRFGVGHATLLSALLFAIWHVRWLAGSWTGLGSSLAISLTIVLLPSLLLAVVYERTRSILATIVLHDVIDGGKLLGWYLVGRA